MNLADSNLSIDLETRMRRGGDSEYITERIYDQLKINEAAGLKVAFFGGGGGGGVSDFTSTGLQGQRCHPISIDRAFTGSNQ